MRLRADHFNETRKELEALEREVREGLDAFPAAREPLAGIDDVPTTATPLTPLPPLPPVGLFEGPDGERMRIAETEARIAELRKLLEEMDRFEARKQTLARKATVLRALKK